MKMLQSRNLQEDQSGQSSLSEGDVEKEMMSLNNRGEQGKGGLIDFYLGKIILFL